MRLHYIGMNGTSGCIPDSCAAYAVEADAIDSLTELLELTDEQKAELTQSGYVRCTGEQGADYAEVSPCTCDAPWEHSEGDTADNWPDYVKKHVQDFLATLEVHKYQDQVTEHTHTRELRTVAKMAH